LKRLKLFGSIKLLHFWDDCYHINLYLPHFLRSYKKQDKELKWVEQWYWISTNNKIMLTFLLSNSGSIRLMFQQYQHQQLLKHQQNQQQLRSYPWIDSKSDNVYPFTFPMSMNNLKLWPWIKKWVNFSLATFVFNREYSYFKRNY
jgi:hypothetical protein